MKISKESIKAAATSVVYGGGNNREVDFMLPFCDIPSPNKLPPVEAVSFDYGPCSKIWHVYFSNEWGSRTSEKIDDCRPGVVKGATVIDGVARWTYTANVEDTRREIVGSCILHLKENRR